MNKMFQTQAIVQILQTVATEVQKTLLTLELLIQELLTAKTVLVTQLEIVTNF